MRIEQLQYMVEVARTGSLSAAAERLHSSQPNISYALKALEEELGVKVFERTRGGATVTDAGEALIQQAQDILMRIDRLKETANNHSSLLFDQLRIGAVPGICNSFLPRLLSTFKSKYPNVYLELVEGNSDEIEADVASGKLHLGLVGLIGHYASKSLHIEPFHACQLVAVVGPQSPLAAHRTLSLADIVQYPVVNISNNIKMELMKYGTPIELFHSTRTEATKHIVGESIATSFYLDISLVKDPYVMMGRILAIPLKEKMTVTLYWLYNDHPPSRAIQVFIEELKNCVRLFTNIGSRDNR